MRKTNKDEKLLTQVELEIMNAVWQLGECTIKDVQKALPRERALAYTSVATIIKILEKKKALGRNEEEHTYYPLLSRKEYESRTLRHVAERIFQGNPSSMAARLIDDGLFRVGSDEYATGDDPTFGVATLLAGHVSLTGPPTVTARFRYLAKGRIERSFAVTGRPIVTAIAALKRTRRRDERLLAYPADDGVWRDVHAADINGYLRLSSGLDMTAKDLRTWHGTLHAAAALALIERGRSAASARRAVASVMREVAQDLGNTPAVARASYVDPRVVDAFLDGRTLDPDVCRRGCGPATERAMLRLLVDG